MAYLCCGPETELSVTYSAAQKDLLIYLWGIEVMTGERGDECVPGWKGALALRNHKIHTDSRKRCSWHVKILHGLPGPHTLPLLAQGIQSTTTSSSYAVRPTATLRTWNWRCSQEEWASTPSSPLPVLCPLTMWSEYSEWTVNRFLAQLLGEKVSGCPAVFFTCA